MGGAELIQCLPGVSLMLSTQGEYAHDQQHGGGGEECCGHGGVAQGLDGDDVRLAEAHQGFNP